jgi:hypothetical protein
MTDAHPWLTMLGLVLVLAFAPPAMADPTQAFTVREWGLRAGGGINPSSQIEYYALHGHAGFSLWRRADEWFAARGVTARWIIEPWAAFVRDNHGVHKTESFEVGVSPIFVRLTFGGTTLRPFVEGGEGILYTDLRKQDLGTRIQFSSQIGPGLEYQLRPDLALNLGVRLRHISNAGLSKKDPGINTIYGLIGVTFR